MGSHFILHFNKSCLVWGGILGNVMCMKKSQVCQLNKGVITLLSPEPAANQLLVFEKDIFFSLSPYYKYGPTKTMACLKISIEFMEETRFKPGTS